MKATGVVLCMTWSGKPNTHRILTLESGKRLWRTIQDPVFPHYGCSGAVCINGVLYYRAHIADSTTIVRFDFRSEKFGFIDVDEDMSLHKSSWNLFNYKGNL